MKLQVLTAMFLLSSFAQAQTSYRTFEPQKRELPISIARPNAVSAELGGRGLLGTVNYDRSISTTMALGIGYSNFSLSDGRSSASFTLLPVYGNFYFSPNKHRGYLSAGGTIFSVETRFMSSSATKRESLGIETTPANSSGSAIIPVVGGGYELHGPFLFRVAAYAFVAKSEILPFAGVSFGGTF